MSPLERLRVVRKAQAAIEALLARNAALEAELEAELERWRLEAESRSHERWTNLPGDLDGR